MYLCLKCGREYNGNNWIVFHSLGQDIGVFEYYKQLIGFKQCGEPWRLMRCIDPREVRVKSVKIFDDTLKDTVGTIPR